MQFQNVANLNSDLADEDEEIGFQWEDPNQAEEHASAEQDRPKPLTGQGSTS